MTDDPYKDLPTDLVALLRDPRISVPGHGDALEKVHEWVQRPVTNNAASAAAGAYITGPPAPARRRRRTTSATSG